MKITTDNKRIGLIHIGKREKSGLQILEKLKQYDFVVKEWDVLSGTDRLVGLEKVNVIVVNIGLTSFEYDDLLGNLFDKNARIIINEAALTNKLTGFERQSWERHLLNKIDSTFSVLPSNVNTSENSDKAIDFSKFGIKEVWLLAASIGGPDAIQKFLSSFAGDEKILFIIIQHIDKEFVPMMAQQLDQNCNLKVKIPISGMKIKASLCIINPTDEYIQFDQTGTLGLQVINEVFSFSPCIDECCRKLLKNIKGLNMAVFSGMSTDGIKAASIIKAAGNKVITQSESSCVLSTIVTGVKKLIEVEFEGTPEQMAQYVIQKTSR